MNEEVVVRFHFIGGEYVDCEYTDKDSYTRSLQILANGGIVVFSRTSIRAEAVTYTEIIKERVMNID